MGAVSRSGLKGFLIGNTAERMLDRLGCDILIVKPDDFRKPVSDTPRGVQVHHPRPLRGGGCGVLSPVN